MVVIAAAVTTNVGRALISRQFVEISRSRIEGLLAAFPKLMSNNANQTFVETENVRYLYQPLESLYVLVITNRSSNIVEDLDTLHLMAKLVPTFCGSLSERAVVSNAFELVFAFDEVLSSGFKEKVNVSRVKTLCEMDSHEEKIHDIVERNKQREAKAAGKQKMEELKKAGGRSSGGMGYNSGYSGGSSVTAPYEPVSSSRPTTTTKKSSTTKKKGMQLGSKSSGSSKYLKTLQDLGELEELEEVPAYDDSSVVVERIEKKAVHVELEESMTVVLTQDSALESMELKGELRIEIIDPTFSHVLVNLAKTNKKFQFRTHPNINKMKFNKESVLSLKDPSKAFPLKTPLGVLKWRFTSNDEGDLPLSVTCWPTPGDQIVTVNLEYELLQEQLGFQDVEIRVPIPSGYTPVIDQADGSYQYSESDSALIWTLPIVDAENANGSLEFTLPFSGDSSVFFPVDVLFSSKTPYSGVSINNIQNIEDNSEIDYSSRINFTASDYQVQFQ